MTNPLKRTQTHLPLPGVGTQPASVFAASCGPAATRPGQAAALRSPRTQGCKTLSPPSGRPSALARRRPRSRARRGPAIPEGAEQPAAAPAHRQKGRRPLPQCFSAAGRTHCRGRGSTDCTTGRRALARRRRVARGRSAPRWAVGRGSRGRRRRARACGAPSASRGRRSRPGGLPPRGRVPAPLAASGA